MIKVVAACGNGMGSSQIIKMKIAKVFKKLGIEATIDHMSVGEAKSAASGYDAVFCGASFVDNYKIKNNKTKVIGLVNLLSEAEIEAKIIENDIK
ncbi:Phosphotransferase system lactose/cellobiose-specific IIB subunit [Candidatus Desulfosporosinus infrequens]|uniref:Phosphotransferase system lactose/cellobiose-specific IIB subunit n=1 Tax=Candidatus Desulfosporosinus infrequens TaxID=2043169 RepID=A0A2U3LEM1_9FIRM|nr:Phosphotransferase system lactose/cellobiose-specific IIB subunit [Candidatus Desulfosporosinus infrequens]